MPPPVSHSDISEEASAAMPPDGGWRDGGVAVEFDFSARTERPIALAEIPAACAAGRFCWFDADLSQDRSKVDEILNALGVPEVARDETTRSDLDGRHDLYEECLHISITAMPEADGALAVRHVNIIIGERFLATLHVGRVEFLEQVRRHYRQDFLRFARTPSFLLYECFDHLLESYRRTAQRMEARVERIQSLIFGTIDDTIFNEVSSTTRELLSFRKHVLAARDVLHELATRRSPFVSEQSQPYLDRMVGTLDRLVSDLSVEREILAGTLNLYMGIVSHRTNRVVNRLTVLSMIFLPLTFLCGVYGMNFGGDKMPELAWQYGYAAFWALCISIAGGLLLFMRRRHWW